jgi:hypothetical protein
MTGLCRNKRLSSDIQFPDGSHDLVGDEYARQKTIAAAKCYPSFIAV